MKTSHLAVAFLLGVMGQPARAEDWWIINIDPRHVIFGDVSTLLRSGETRTIWTRMDFREPDARGWIATISHERYDCIQKSQLVLEAIDYDADGKSIGRVGAQPIKMAPPGTNLRSVIDEVCALTPSSIQLGKSNQIFRIKETADLHKFSTMLLDKIAPDER